MEMVPVVTPLSRAEIESRTQAILRKVDPKAFSGKRPTDIEYILDVFIMETHGIVVGYTDDLPDNAYGYTDIARKECLIRRELYESTKQEKRRFFRATGGHEGGHCCLHVNLLHLQSLSRGDAGLYRKKLSTIRAFENPEWQAWEFAGGLLIPKHLLMERLAKGWSLNDLSDSFDVNKRFIETRVSRLHIDHLVAEKKPLGAATPRGFLPPKTKPWSRSGALT